MANDLVTTQRNPIMAMGSALVRANAHPGLSEARGRRPRTMLIGRMLAGAGESDLLMANLLCLPPSEESFGIALFGEPAGPTFKTHPEGLKARFDADDPGAIGEFIDWRLSLETTTIIASFDPSCAAALIETLHLFRNDFAGVPVDVLFMAARDEQNPRLVTRLQQVAERVVVARMATLSSRFEPTRNVEVPVLTKGLGEPYQSCDGPLRNLVKGLGDGSQAMFASALRKFSIALEEQLRD